METRKRSPGGHRKWLLLYVLPGCLVISLLTHLTACLFRVVKYGEALGANIDFIFAALGSILFFIPTLIAGTLITLLALRRGTVGALASVAIAVVVYAAIFGRLVAVYTGVYAETDDAGAMLAGFVTPAAFVTLLFSFFLPKPDNRAEAVLKTDDTEKEYPQAQRRILPHGKRAET